MKNAEEHVQTQLKSIKEMHDAFTKLQEQKLILKHTQHIIRMQGQAPPDDRSVSLNDDGAGATTQGGRPDKAPLLDENRIALNTIAGTINTDES